MNQKLLVFLILIACIFFFFISGCRYTGTKNGKKIRQKGMNIVTDSLPDVFISNHADFIAGRLKNEACLRFARLQLPNNRQEWESFRSDLKNQILEKAGISIDHELPLDVHETGSTKMNGYTIKNIFFQTLPGVYATANLFIPDGKGPFPAVISMHGHWPEAKLAGPVQSIGHTLALQGYIVLSIDAFGAGERSMVHGIYDYHGANLGASLMNVGKTLLGIQVSENMRGVDLLCSLPEVDREHIGATGASGGGNQTMWLAAMDERIKAAVPIVSVGTFESYITESNCVCELLPDGLTLTEESGILALMAPRAVLLCNHSRESNPTFFPAEMLRSYNNAQPVFDMLGVKDNIGYRIFDLEHDYAKEDREAMIGWFNLHLKGTGKGEPVKELAFKTLPADQLMVFQKASRHPKVKNIAEYCIQKGEGLRNTFLSAKTFNTNQKRDELLEILGIHEYPFLKDVQQYSSTGGWERFILETSDGRLIPLLLVAPLDKFHGYVLMCDPLGKKNIQPDRIKELFNNGKGIAIIDLSGTGEVASPKADLFDKGTVRFHTIARADLWLGRTVLGDWITEIGLTTQFLKNTCKALNVSIDAGREAGLAGLYYAVLNPGEVIDVAMYEAPVSYLFDTRNGLDFFSMATYLPGFLAWGDVSLAAALSGINVTFSKPVTMSGNAVNDEKLQTYKEEFKKIRKICKKPGKTIF
jgi:hypothetical protein